MLYRSGKLVEILPISFHWLDPPHPAPAVPICRSQAEIEIEGDWHRLLRELRGFHQLMVYGDYLEELGYAVRKAGLNWVKI